MGILIQTVGSGTAIIESINNRRNGIGIELEWPELCKKNIEHQTNSLIWKGITINGNAHNMDDLLKPYKPKFKLIVKWYAISGYRRREKFRCTSTQKRRYRQLSTRRKFRFIKME